jgi:fructose-1,6-bisphosphatase/inositol monophosphatase family enzyme
MNLVETLQSLEPVFIKAGELALKMQKGVKHHDKYNTGNSALDIVTEADLGVQEFLLQEIAKTDLINCRLLAEEDTPSAKKFNEKGKYYLGIDPIDGTANYAQGDDYFSTIISLHDGQNILYMFIHYPALNWTHRVVNNNYSVSGETPNLVLPPEIQNTIVYWSGNPEKNIPKEICMELGNKGIKFRKITEISKHIDGITMFAFNKVAGIYYEDMNVYDGLAEYSIALVRGSRIYSGGPNGRLDLSNIKKRDFGLYYPGFYLALN